MGNVDPECRGCDVGSFEQALDRPAESGDVADGFIEAQRGVDADFFP